MAEAPGLLAPPQPPSQPPPASKGPSFNTLARVFFTLVLFAGALYLVYLIRDVVVLLFIAAFLSVALGPAVDFFHRRRIPRAASILLVYLMGLVAVFLVGLLVVPPIVSQVEDVAKQAPKYIQDIRNNPTLREYDDKYKITQKLEQQASKLPSVLGTAAGTLQSVTVGVFSAAVKLIAVLSITFFLLLDGERLTNFLFGLMRPEREARWRTVGRQVYGAVAGYVAGNLIISVVAGLVTYATLELLGVPFAVPLSVLVAFLDLIPLVGATIGAVVVGLVSLFVDFPTATIVWIIVAIVYQQAENHIVQPIVYRETVDVRPLVVIVSILIGAALLGVLGALVAIPVAATVQIILRDWWERRQEHRAEHVLLPPDVEPEPE
ncbi:MAG TPA: AI-2E family transporter [Solirubrobacteraceae bacterium]|nr:AI-2E family transporter [Solirubrobacteraceae bacterium]